jgi:predicted hotdog family 3-hydroxylacyl-ACP dehydratase
MTDFPAIESLIPHRAPMVFLDRVSEFTTTRLVAHYLPPLGHWCGERGLPSFMGIEIIAQAIAAHNSLHSRQTNANAAPSLGVLLGTRRYEATQPFFPLAEEITVVIEEKMQDASGFGAYAGVLFSARQAKLASATVKVFRPADFRAYITSPRTP